MDQNRLRKARGLNSRCPVNQMEFRSILKKAPEILILRPLKMDIVTCKRIQLSIKAVAEIQLTAIYSENYK